MKLLPKIILTTLVPVGLVSSAGVLLVASDPNPSPLLAMLVIATTIVVALMASLLLRNILMSPLERLVRAHADLAKGDLAARVRIEGDDEIAQLAASFNGMAQSLQSTEQRFRTIFEAFPAPILLSRLRDGHFIDANPAFCAVVGMTREQLIGKTTTQIGMQSLVGDWHDPQHLETLMQAGTLDKQQVMVRDKRGREYWTLFSTRLIEVDNEKAALTVALDITRQKAAEAKLLATNEELKRQTMLAQAVVQVQSDFIKDRDPRHAFDLLLARLLALTASEYGFIGEVLFTRERRPYLKTHASAAQGMAFDNFDGLLGVVLNSRAPLIANDPANDPRHAGLPRLHQPMQAFLGLPVMVGDNIVAIIGMANRAGGYDDALVAWLQPMIATVGQLMASVRAKHDLQQSEDRFRTMFEAFPSPITLHRLEDTRFIDANPAFCEAGGVRREELIGRTPYEAGLSVNPDIDAMHVDQLKRTGELLSVEIPLQARDGNVRWVLTNTRVINIGGEKVALSVAIDITQQKATELALRAANARLRVFSTAIDNSGEGIVLIHNDAYIDCNLAALAMFGCTREQMIGHSPLEFSPEYQPGGELSRALTERFVTAVQKGEAMRTRWQHKRPDGTLFTVDVCTSMVSETFEEGTNYLVAVLRDITEQMRVQDALRASNDRLRVFDAMVQNSTDAMLLIDEEGRALECNDATLVMFGCTREQFIDCEPLQFTPALQPDGSNSAERAQQILAAALAGTPQRNSWQHIRADGSPFQVDVTLNLIDDVTGTGNRRLVSVMRNVTRQQQAEQELIASEKRFRAIFDAFPYSIVLTSLADGRYVDINPAHCATNGIAREQWIGRTREELGVPPVPNAEALIERLLVTGKIDQQEMTLPLRDGGSRWILYSARRVQLGDEQLALSVSFDITRQKDVERELVASEQRFRAIFEAFPYPIALTDIESGLYVDVNAAMCRQRNQPREQIVGRKPEDLGIKVDPQYPSLVEQMLREGTVDQSISKIYLPGGKTEWYLYSAQVIHLGGRPVIMAVAVDITRQKDIEQALRESNEHLRQTTAMVENSNDAMLFCSPDATFLDCNNAALKMFGCTRAQFVGSHPVQFSPQTQPDGRDSAALAKQLVETALAGEPQRFIWQHVRADGTPFMAEVALNRITDDGGEAVRLMAVLRDVTSEMQARTALEESEKRFRAVFDAFPYSIVLTDLEDGTYVDVNPAHCAFSGCTREELIGRSRNDLGFRDLSESNARIRELLHTGKLEQQTTKWRDRNGNAKWGLYSTQLIRLGGKTLALSVSFDITRQKEIEQELQELNASLESRVTQRTHELREALETLTRAQHELVRSEKLASLGSLVAGVAHELNTPIGNAVMMASTLADREREFAQRAEQGLTRSALTQFADTVRESSDILLRNLRRAAELISSFKQVAVDQSSYQRREFTLDEVAEEITLALSPSLRHSGVTLRSEISPGIEFDSYPGPLGQVLMNLINNAMVHAFAEGAPGSIVIRGQGGTGERVLITVGDNGCGMAEDVQLRIFDPFFTTKLGQGGSGLGLHITYNLVTGLLGGSIRVRSRVGEGTWFDIELPRHAPAAKPEQLQ